MVRKATTVAGVTSNLEQGIHADTEQDVVQHGDDCRHGHAPLQPPGDETGHQHHEHNKGAESLFV